MLYSDCVEEQFHNNNWKHTLFWERVRDNSTQNYFEGYTINHENIALIATNVIGILLNQLRGTSCPLLSVHN